MNKSLGLLLPIDTLEVISGWVSAYWYMHKIKYALHLDKWKVIYLGEFTREMAVADCEEPSCK